MRAKWEESFRICLSVMFGGLIGYLLMDKIATSYELGSYFIWVGLLGGCVTGAVSYRFGQITTACRQTWQKMVTWRPNYEWWMGVGLLVNYLLTITTVTFLVSFFTLLLFVRESNGLMISTFFATIFALLSFVLAMVIIIEECVAKIDCRDMMIEATFDPKTFNPITISFWLLIWTARFVILGGKKVWRWLRENSRRQVMGGTRFAASFCWQVFILIHSRARTIVFIDSGVAALLAYRLGYDLTGLLFALFLGGLWGVINYQLVAVCWLKLKPVPTRN
ncbi:MAG: hypothetical protein Q7T49_01040 [bacterium]|nr:hypothetical protein [bacterium]